jgi:hypothetical protein
MPFNNDPKNSENPEFQRLLDLVAQAPEFVEDGLDDAMYRKALAEYRAHRATRYSMEPKSES